MNGHDPTKVSATIFNRCLPSLIYRSERHACMCTCGRGACTSSIILMAEDDGCHPSWPLTVRRALGGSSTGPLTREGGAGYEDAIAFATPYADHGLISTRASAALLETLLHPAEENKSFRLLGPSPLDLNQSLGSLTAARCPFDFGLVDSIAPLMCHIHTADMANLLVEFHRTICKLQRLNQHHDHGTVVHEGTWRET